MNTMTLFFGNASSPFEYEREDHLQHLQACKNRIWWREDVNRHFQILKHLEPTPTSPQHRPQIRIAISPKNTPLILDPPARRTTR